MRCDALAGREEQFVRLIIALITQMATPPTQEFQADETLESKIGMSLQPLTDPKRFLLSLSGGHRINSCICARRWTS
jgi:hypothetical protein